MKPETIINALQSDMDPALILAAARGLRHAAIKRPYDVAIGGADNPYMLRWWLIPRNKHGINIYLHHFLRSDDDRALHDHPWANVSYLIEGSYIEEVPRYAHEPAGPKIRILRQEGSITWRPPEAVHRIELIRGLPRRPVGGPLSDAEAAEIMKPQSLIELPTWSLFITGPKVREWGFWCPRGWVDWMTFTGQDESDGPVRLYNQVRGCGET